jgi:hypothetical protein
MADHPRQAPDLVAFLRARLDEDEHKARAATQGSWMEKNGNVSDLVADRVYKAVDREHIIRWQPSRVLAEVAVKRRIIAQYEYAVEHPDEISPDGFLVSVPISRKALRDVVKLLARPYRNHPEYREDWRP